MLELVWCVAVGERPKDWPCTALHCTVLHYCRSTNWRRPPPPSTCTCSKRGMQTFAIGTRFGERSAAHANLADLQQD